MGERKEMTDKQINKLTNIELLEAYKQKQLCEHSFNTSSKLLREINRRRISMKLGLYSVSTGVSHLISEGRTKENVGMFVDMIDQIIWNERNLFK